MEVVAEYSRGKLIYFLLFMWVVKSDIWDNFLSLMNYDVWSYLSEKFDISPKKKFNLFFYSLIILAFLLDMYVIQSSFVFFAYTLIFGISMMINDKKFYEIKDVTLWELLLGLVGIISAFTIVTPIKWHFFPQTRVFGVFNGGILILGYFVLFYGLRKYKTVLPFLVYYFLLMLLHGSWNFVVKDFAERYISPISSHLAYSILKWLGYPASISGTTISIITQNGNTISATVAGPCSGIESMTLSTIMLVGLFIGSSIKYLWRTIIIVIAIFTVFFINVFRLSLIFIAAYYWEYTGFELGHTWFGTVLFMTFILSYWYVITKKYEGKRDVQHGE